MKIKRIGILTGGGDCSGLNAVLRTFVKKAIHTHGIEVIGFLDGYEGLVKNKYKKLENKDVSGILTIGGTILGTSNVANPFKYVIQEKPKLITKDLSKQALQVYKKLKLDGLVCIGGDGTLSTAYKLLQIGMNIIGVPKTIDNDLMHTDKTFGFDTAVSVAAEAIDRLHTTAQSHHRVMIIEVMGRYAGWIALYSGVAGGGDIILIPEIPYKMEKILETLKYRERLGKKFTIIVVAEGAKPEGGKIFVSKIIESSPDPVRLGGIGIHLGEEIGKRSGKECRVVVLGHLQRGGSPVPSDRILASSYGYEALNLVLKNKFGYMVALQNNKIVPVSLSKIAGKIKPVPIDHELIQMSKGIGVSFGI
jgi:ATP-dependent phosphofructokinase / diphosphate-dependent phosphofructokinase